MPIILPTNEYYLGTRVGVLAEFANEAEVPTNPTTVRFYAKGPSQALQTFVYGTDGEVTQLSTGNYRFRFTPAVVGNWIVGAEGTGDVEIYGELTVKILKRKAV